MKYVAMVYFRELQTRRFVGVNRDLQKYVETAEVNEDFDALDKIIDMRDSKNREEGNNRATVVGIMDNSVFRAYFQEDGTFSGYFKGASAKPLTGKWKD